MNVINKFDGEYFFLSNFYPTFIVYEDMVYSCVEGAYQAAKSLSLTDRKCFTNLNGSQAKKLGRRVELREDWEDVKVEVMRTCLQHKFFKHPELADKLLATGDATLIEGNTWGDTFWGVCNGVGKNYLGELLMQIRSELRGKDCSDEEFVTDEIGGKHSEGLGWNPDGTFCGECCNATCKGCPNVKEEK